VRRAHPNSGLAASSLRYEHGQGGRLCVAHSAGLDVKNELFADSVGWSDIADQVATFYADVPEAERQSTVIISAYYGVPGALQIYADPSTRPVAVSPQLEAPIQSVWGRLRNFS
jgi:hypothetical protein